MSLMSVVIAILLFFGFAAWMGSRLPKTHVAASRQRINAPVAEVWDAVVSFADYPQWRPGLARVDAGPLIDGNPSWYEYCAPKIRVQLRFCELQPQKRLVTRLVGERLPIYGAWEYEFAEDGDGTLLTITEIDRVYHPVLRFFTLFAFPHHAAMDVFLIALAKRCGGGGAPQHLSLKLDETGESLLSGS